MHSNFQEEITELDLSDNCSSYSPHKEFVSSYFNVEVKSKREGGSCIYSTFENVTDVNPKNSITVDTFSTFTKQSKTPALMTRNYESNRVYKNISTSQEKRCITPNMHCPDTNYFPLVAAKGMVPSMPQKKNNFWINIGYNSMVSYIYSTIYSTLTPKQLLIKQWVKQALIVRIKIWLLFLIWINQTWRRLLREFISIILSLEWRPKECIVYTSANEQN